MEERECERERVTPIGGSKLWEEKSRGAAIGAQGRENGGGRGGGQRKK